MSGFLILFAVGVPSLLAVSWLIPTRAEARLMRVKL